MSVAGGLLGAFRVPNPMVELVLAGMLRTLGNWEAPLAIRLSRGASGASAGGQIRRRRVDESVRRSGIQAQ